MPNLHNPHSASLRWRPRQLRRTRSSGRTSSSPHTQRGWNRYPCQLPELRRLGRPEMTRSCTRVFRTRRSMRYTGPRRQPTSGINVGVFVSELTHFAMIEDALSINEFHVAEIFVKLGGESLTRTGVNGPLMVKLVGEELGRVEPSPEDREKVWCFCDTTFFQESRALSDQIDWPSALGVLAPVVLAVVPVVVRELDAQKGDPRQHRSRQRDRARLDPIIDRRGGDRPVFVRPGVEILLIDREPAVLPEGFSSGSRGRPNRCQRARLPLATPRPSSSDPF
jgi:hypothetical protein